MNRLVMIPILVAGLLLYNAALVILFLDAGMIDKMQADAVGRNVSIDRLSHVRSARV